jgi:hypothetical protein
LENKGMDNRRSKNVQYYVLCVSAFARQKGISYTEAYNYLYKHNGIDFLVDCYDAEHTLSINDAVNDLTQVCKNNGGSIE